MEQPILEDAAKAAILRRIPELAAKADPHELACLAKAYNDVTQPDLASIVAGGESFIPNTPIKK